MFYVISDSGVVHRWHLSNNDRFKLNIGVFFTRGPARHLSEREHPHQTSWAVPVQVSALHWARSDCWHLDSWNQVWGNEAGTQFWFLHNYPAIRAKQKCVPSSKGKWVPSPPDKLEGLRKQTPKHDSKTADTVPVVGFWSSHFWWQYDDFLETDKTKLLL